MRSLLLLLAVLLTGAAACLVHGADEPTTPRRSLTFVDLIPTRPRSESDKRKCLENMLALCGSCKHELFLASLFPERHVPFACCRAADEVDDHCGPLTRTFFRAVLPRGIFQRCARQVTIIRAPTTTVPSVSGGRAARAPPVPEAQTSVSPPRAAGASGGATYAAPAPKTLHAGAPKVFGRVVPRPVAGSASVHPPPQYPVTVPSSKRTPSVGSGGQREAGAPRASITVPVNEDVPKPKVISAGGSAGGRTRRTPGGSYGPATPAPEAQTVAARVPPPRAARASGGTHAAPGPKPHAPKLSDGVRSPIAGSTSVYLPPPYPVTTVPSGKHTPPPPLSPKVVGSGTYVPVVSGGIPSAAGAPRSSAVPVNEDVPKPKVISAGGSASGQMRRAPGGVHGPVTGAPSAPVASGSPHAAGAPRSSGVPVNEDVPKPKVISTGGSAGGRARRAPAGVYGAATSPPLSAAVPPPKKGTVENAGGSATGQTRHAPGGYGPATDY